MVRLRATYTVEYLADPDDYGTSDPYAMAAIDAEGLNDDPGTLLDLGGQDDQDIVVEVV